MSGLIATELGADGVLTAVIDMPGRSMNVFSNDLMDALDALITRAEADEAVKSIVLTSGKSSFLAGADLVMVRGFTTTAKTATHEEMFQLCGRLGRLFVRLEASAKPWVAAVNGIALGGGFELALACRARLVADDARIQLGVPEVRWGLLPGAGGTQRLPRLAGFDAAMDLLLSGRSMHPDEAVRLGIFARALPAAQLLDQARAVARSQHGQPYDAGCKFAHLAQTDVPDHDEATARSIAAKHGVTEENFALYPAYSAIVDSVLKGARLPLANATAVEMNQFLRLMFNPVAGNMVRTLFLERLRAERELAAPPETRIQSIRIGTISAVRNAWVEALAKLKIPQVKDATLPSDTLDLLDQNAQSHRVALRVLDEAPDAPGHTAAGAPIAVLCPPGPYGRMLETVGAQGSTADSLAALAANMRALLWPTPGPSSVLQQLRGQSLLAQATTALEYTTSTGDPVFLNVAACVAGITPVWTGGPLNWLWAEQKNVVPQLDATAQSAWNVLAPRLQEACT